MSNVAAMAALAAVVSAALLLPVPGCTADSAQTHDESELTDVEGGVPTRGAIVISQVYGGGGLAGAARDHDFVELLNRTKGPLALDGLSLQYADATGDFGAGDAGIVPLSGTVGPGEYVLIELDSSPPGDGDSLPSRDLGGSLSIDPATGKLALGMSTAPLGCGRLGAHCSASKVLDIVGYGAVSEYEGTASAPPLDPSKAAIRKGNGCTDTNDNAADFAAGSPTPRNGTSTADCTAPPKEAGAVPPVLDPPLGKEGVDKDAGPRRDAGGPQADGGSTSTGCALTMVGRESRPWDLLFAAAVVCFVRRRRRT